MATNGNAEPHVPAWKRLGLQLKNGTKSEHAKDANSPPFKPSSFAQSNGATSKHRTNSYQSLTTPEANGRSQFPRKGAQRQDENAASPSSNPNEILLKYSTSHFATARGQEVNKKRKRGDPKPDLEVTADNTARNASLHGSSTENHADTHMISAVKPSTPGHKRRKSVSFTPDTKSGDSDTRDRFAAYKLLHPSLEDRGSQSPSPEPESGKVKSILKPSTETPDAWETDAKGALKQDSASVAARKAAKKAKREERRKGVPREEGESVYLGYLKGYKDNRGEWKFNKNAQTELFKHVFDTEKVPVQFNEALREYVVGLQGVAVRTQLGEEAKAVLERLDLEDKGKGEDIEMPDLATRKRAYDEALEDHLLKDNARRMADAVLRPRAELIQAALRESAANIRKQMEAAENGTASGSSNRNTNAIQGQETAGGPKRLKDRSSVGPRGVEPGDADSDPSSDASDSSPADNDLSSDDDSSEESSATDENDAVAMTRGGLLPDPEMSDIGSESGSESGSVTDSDGGSDVSSNSAIGSEDEDMDSDESASSASSASSPRR